MKIHIRMVLAFVLAGFSPLLFGENLFYDDCTVTLLKEVSGVGSFSCQVAEKDPLASLPLRVSIRGVNELDKPELNAAGMVFVEMKLKAAEKIKLKNVEMTGYCKVTADVSVNGKDLAGELFGNMPAFGPVRSVPVNVVRTQTMMPVESAVPVRQESRAAVQRQYADAGYISRGIVFTPDTTLGEAFEMIANAAQPRLPLLIMWEDLEENCFVDRDTPIGLEYNGPIKISKALEMLLRSIDAQYAIDGGVITIASNEMDLPRRLITKVYDLRELNMAQQGYYGNRYGNQYGNQYNGMNNYNSYGNNYGNYNNMNNGNNNNYNSPFGIMR